jgi:hypothetical protein
MAPEKSFAEATAVKAISSHTYSAEFPDDWCIGSGTSILIILKIEILTLLIVPHGGFITATFLQVATAHFKTTLSTQNQPHTIAMHLDFLRRTQVGPALFTVTDTKLGRQASVITIKLTQGPALSREEVIGSMFNAPLYLAHSGNLKLYRPRAITPTNTLQP